MAENMTVHPVESELLKVTGLRPPSSREPKMLELFRRQVVQEVDKLKDDAFDMLSDDAQGWVNRAVNAMVNGDGPPDFDPDDDEPNVSDETPGDDEDESNESTAEAASPEGAGGEENTDPPEPPDIPAEVAAFETTVEATTATKVPPKATGKAKVKPKAKAKAKAQKTTRKHGKPAGWRVKELMLENGLDSDPLVIIAELRKEHLRMSDQTLASIRYEFKQALQVLHAEGYLNKTPDHFVPKEHK